MKKLIGVIIVSSILSGCAAPYQGTQNTQYIKPVKQMVKRPAFPADEYAALPKKGTGKIKGELFGVTRGGDVKIGAGKEITVRPYTSYQKNTPAFDYNTQTIEDIDNRVLAYDRKMNTDAQGKFEFDDLPPGKYKVFGYFSWQAGSFPQFVSIDKIVDVKNGVVTQVQP